MVHESKTPKVTQSRKKKAGSTQIDPAIVTQNCNRHANNEKQNVMTKVDNNYGFDKCGSFAEIAILALHRALEINKNDLAHVNVYMNGSKEDLSVYFYSKAPSCSHYAAFYANDGAQATLSDLNDAFSRYENIGKEVCHA